MPLVLHTVAVDGSQAHSDFDKASWEAAMRDPNVARAWGHDPEDCFDPVERLRAQLAARGQLGRRSTPVQTQETAPPPTAQILEPVVWPPDIPLSLQQFSEMSGLCREDCHHILHRWRWNREADRVHAPMDADGNPTLF